MRRTHPLLGLILTVALAAGCSDDGGVLSDNATTAPATTDATGTEATTTTRAPATSRPRTTSPSKTVVPRTSATPPGVSFDPPRPQTTPNVAQPPDSLLDGTHVAFLVDVDVRDRQVQIDVVQWFYRADFDEAIAAGRLRPDEPCIDLDYCLVNNDDRVRTMNVKPTARVSIVDYDHCCGSVRTDDLVSAFDRMRDGRDLFLLTAEDGVIVALDEIYLA